jgi:uncharacterized membrane protein YdjX (TVP38/TMEM64 family)
MRSPDRGGGNGQPAAAATLRALLTLLGIGAWAAISYAEGGIVAIMLRPDLAATDKLEELQAFFAGLGAVAPFAYVAIVTVVVVVAPIPGTVLYAPAGVIFGGFWGGVLSLLGNVAGAALSFALMRALGRAAFERWIAAEQLEAIEQRLVERGSLIVFLLRVNPLTSSDIVSYAAGATSMPLRKLLLGTTLGMAPLCFLQSYLAESLMTAYPRLIYLLLAAGMVYVVLFVAILFRAGAKVRAERAFDPRDA